MTVLRQGRSMLAAGSCRAPFLWELSSTRIRHIDREKRKEVQNEKEYWNYSHNDFCADDGCLRTEP